LDPIEVLRFEQRAVKARRGGVELSRFYKGVPHMRRVTAILSVAAVVLMAAGLVATSAPGRNGAAPDVTKVTYKKYERGFGG
jgi:hypothetical protein